jgi:hypothetical protein
MRVVHPTSKTILRYADDNSCHGDGDDSYDCHGDGGDVDGYGYGDGYVMVSYDASGASYIKDDLEVTQCFPHRC